MLTLKARPHDRVQITRSELGFSPNDLADLPWVVERVASIRTTRVGLEIVVGPFVGQLVVPDGLILDVRETFPGTLAACLNITTLGRRAGPQESGRGTVPVQPWDPVVTRFAAELLAYIQRGAEKRYLGHRLTTSRPRGRLDIHRTATRVWPRGRTDLLACEIRLLTEDTHLNRAFLSAGVKAEAIARQAGIHGTLRDLRLACRALSGARLVQAPSVFSAKAEIGPHQPELVSLLGVAEIILDGVPALPPPRVEDKVFPISAWLNGEKIFEDAVRHVVAEAAPAGTVRPGKGDGVKLMTHIPDSPGDTLADADPDVVVSTPEGVLILDAKYRRHGDAYSEGELYQLIAHARAYEAWAAALVAPAVQRSPGVYAIGVDNSSTAYYVIAVDPASEWSFRQHISQWVRDRLKRTIE